MNYKTIIGLEIHAQLLTKTKAFCDCKNDSRESTPNKNICPVCTAHPGTLPVLNREMVLMAVKSAIALNCRINTVSSFDRKNYFYPDMPKGYQITQYFSPIANDGHLEIISKKRKKNIRINRIHMEEDSAKMIRKNDRTLIDFNRCGIPLIEIVTEPDMNSPEEAVMFLEVLKNILMYINVCDGNLENGSMRCDVNISVVDTERGIASNRVEIKNLNSFKNVQKSLQYETNYQKKLLQSGMFEVQSTKTWDEKKKQTRIMRNKECESEYRYFPEPDLPLLRVEERDILQMTEKIPELPSEKLKRLIDTYYLRYEEARILVTSPDLADFFEQVSIKTASKEAIKWILRDVKRYLNEKGKPLKETKLTPVKLAELLNQIKIGRISNSTAEEILQQMFENDRKLSDIIEADDFLQQNDKDLLCEYMEDVISENYEQYEAYTLGKKELFNFFVGKMMRKTKGRTRPDLILKTIRNRLG